MQSRWGRDWHLNETCRRRDRLRSDKPGILLPSSWYQTCQSQSSHHICSGCCRYKASFGSAPPTSWKSSCTCMISLLLGTVQGTKALEVSDIADFKNTPFASINSIVQPIGLVPTDGTVVSWSGVDLFTMKLVGQWYQQNYGVCCNGCFGLGEWGSNVEGFFFFFFFFVGYFIKRRSYWYSFHFCWGLANQIYFVWFLFENIAFWENILARKIQNLLLEIGCSIL